MSKQAVRESISGKFLKECRVKAGLSQEQVAKSLNYSTSQFISNWECGKSLPPVSALPILSEVLKIPVPEFLSIMSRCQDRIYQDKLTTKLTGLRARKWERAMNATHPNQVSIEVVEKEVSVQGESLLVNILKMRGGEFLTYQQAAEVLGSSVGNIKFHISNQKMSVSKTNEHELAELKRQGVIPLKAPTANVIDKEGMRTLVRVINTPEADAAYRQLWEVAEKAYEVHTTYQTDPNIITAITSMNDYMKSISKLAEATMEVTKLLAERVTALENQKPVTQATVTPINASNTEDMVLTLLQRDALDLLIKVKNSHLPAPQRYKHCGYIKRRIKEEFIPHGFRSQRKYYEVAQKDFERVKNLVINLSQKAT